MKGGRRDGVGGRGGNREDGAAVRSGTRRRLGRRREPQPLWLVATPALGRPGNHNSPRSLELISALDTEGQHRTCVKTSHSRAAAPSSCRRARGPGGKGARRPAEVRGLPARNRGCRKDCRPRGMYLAAAANAAPHSNSYPDGKKLPIPVSPQRARDVFRMIVRV